MKFSGLIRQLNDWGPLLFGVGFIAPLIAQSMDMLELGAPPGLSPLALGLIVGAAMGLVAKRRGTWI